jgi:hypothetical protein
MHIGLHHHRQQGPVDPSARLQQRREERPLPQLGNLEFHIAGLGRQQPRAGSIAVGRPAGAALVAAGPNHLDGLDVNQRLQYLADNI